MVGPWLSMVSQKGLEFHKKYLNLCSKDKQRSYGFEMTYTCDIPVSRYSILCTVCLHRL